MGLALQLSSSSFSQTSLSKYTDSEIIELANYVKKLERSSASLNQQGFNRVRATINKRTKKSCRFHIFVNNYNTTGCNADSDVIKLANYIKYLKKMENQNSIVCETSTNTLESESVDNKQP